MNLYLLERVDEVDYDEWEGFVVCANSDQEAREVASRPVSTWHDEKARWSDASQTTCRQIGTGPAFEPAIILGSFRAG